MNNEKQVAALRIWLEPPNLVVSYERRGIVTMTISLRQELAVTVSRTLAEKAGRVCCIGCGGSGATENDERSRRHGARSVRRQRQTNSASRARWKVAARRPVRRSVMSTELRCYYCRVLDGKDELAHACREHSKMES